MGRRGKSSPGDALRTVHCFSSHLPRPPSKGIHSSFPIRRQKDLAAVLGGGLEESMPPSDTAGASLAPSRALFVSLHHSSQCTMQEHRQQPQLPLLGGTRRLPIQLGPRMVLLNQLVLFPPETYYLKQKALAPTAPESRLQQPGFPQPP